LKSCWDWFAKESFVGGEIEARARRARAVA
jgi:hypothetical protein